MNATNSTVIMRVSVQWYMSSLIPFRCYLLYLGDIK